MIAALSQLLRFLNRYARFTVCLDLAGISVIKDFIRLDHSATFTRMNRHDADVHIACSVSTSIVTLDTPRRAYSRFRGNSQGRNTLAAHG